MKYRLRARVERRADIAPRHVKLALTAPDIAAVAEPGQFVSVFIEEPEVRTKPRLDARDLWDHAEPSEVRPCILPRPFGLHRVAGAVLEIAFKVTGKGTRKLAQLEPGSEVEVLGPLGSSFRADPGRPCAVLVAGGTGLFPLFFLAERLRGSGKAVHVLAGALETVPMESSDSRIALSFLDPNVTVVINEFDRIGCVSRVASESGAPGTHRGLVTELLARFLDAPQVVCGDSVQVFACGPWAMLRVVAEMCTRRTIPCQVLLEQRMACGIGACMSCVVPTRETGYKHYKRVCCEGPVFEAEEIDWDGT